MHYLIDGHNLIDQMPDISLSDPEDEAKLVQRLKQFAARHRCRCTVVFDHGLPGGLARQLSNSQVEVIFAHSGTDADRIIQQRLRAQVDRRALTVVSNDRQVIAEAARLKIAVVPSSDFARRLVRSAAASAWDDKPPDRPLSPAELQEWERLFGHGEEK